MIMYFLKGQHIFFLFRRTYKREREKKEREGVRKQEIVNMEVWFWYYAPSNPFGAVLGVTVT